MAQSPTWIARPEILPRIRARAVFDEDRQRVVAFGGFIGNGQTNQTIEWDGQEWILRTPVHAPSARDLHAVAYDAARQRTVLFGGAGASNDTWTWDGHDWTARSSAKLPPGRVLLAMAFDPVRGRVVLFGGSNASSIFNDTWEWDGARWTLANPIARPPQREFHAMAWDPSGQRVLVAGGNNLQGPQTDTWGFDGVTWTQLATTGPSSIGGTMATDPLRGRVVAYDGTQTWEWNGVAWAAIATAHSPPQVSRFSMAFDARRGGIVLGFGGLNEYVSDTWLYDGVDWTLVDARGQPFSSVLATDTTRGRVVLRTNTLYTSHTTWEWDGVRWNAIDSATAPNGRIPVQSVAFDANRQRTVQFGGVQTIGGMPVYNNLHWEWDGTNWSQVPPAGTIPSPRNGASLAFDATRSRLLLFGGNDGNGNLDDTWEWDGTNWSLRSPANRPSARTRALLAHDPQRGVVVMLGNTFGTARDTWEWNGLDWQAKTSSNTPPQSGLSSMTYDPSRGRVVVVAFDSPTQTSQTWEWDGVDWTRSADVPTGSVAPQGVAWDPIQQRLLAVDDL